MFVSKYSISVLNGLTKLGTKQQASTSQNYEITKHRLKDKVPPNRASKYASINLYFNHNRLFPRRVILLQVLRIRGYQTRNT